MKSDENRHQPGGVEEDILTPNGSEEQILTDNSESDLLRSSNEKNTYAYDPEKFANRYKPWGTPSQAYGVTAQR